MKKNFWEDFEKLFDNFSDNFNIGNSSPEGFINGEYIKTEQHGVDENGDSFTEEIYTAKDGKKTFTRKIINQKNTYTKQTEKNTKAMPQKEFLEQELALAIKKEDYKRATRLRDEIDLLNNSLQEVLIKRIKNKDGTHSDKILVRGMKGFSKEELDKVIIDMCKSTINNRSKK